MRILLMCLAVLLPSAAIAQTVSRAELRNTNNVLLSSNATKLHTNGATVFNLTSRAGSATAIAYTLQPFVGGVGDWLRINSTNGSILHRVDSNGAWRIGFDAFFNNGVDVSGAFTGVEGTFSGAFVANDTATFNSSITANNLASNASPVSFAGFLADGTLVETEAPSVGTLPQTLDNLNTGTTQTQTNQSGLAKDAAITFKNAASTTLITIPHNSTALDFPQGFTAPSAVIDGTDLAPWVTFLAIADPNADRLLVWDDSDGAFQYLDPASLGGGADFYGQNATTNLTVINHTAASGAYLVLSNAAGDQLNFISYYHGGAAPSTSLSFDTVVGSNTFRLFPGPLTSFPPFLTMDRAGRSLMFGYGGDASVNTISNKANTTIQSNLVVNGTTSLEGGVSIGGGAGILHLLTMTNAPTDSNFVANFDAGNKQFWFPAEANINIPHATNVSGNWSTSKVVSVYLDLRGKAYNGRLSWPSSFNEIGVATTNNAVLASNKIHRLALENYGPGQTNTDIAIGYGQ